MHHEQLQSNADMPEVVLERSQVPAEDLTALAAEPGNHLRFIPGLRTQYAKVLAIEKPQHGAIAVSREFLDPGRGNRKLRAERRRSTNRKHDHGSGEYAGKHHKEHTTKFHKIKTRLKYCRYEGWRIRLTSTERVRSPLPKLTVDINKRVSNGEVFTPIFIGIWLRRCSLRRPRPRR